jgi:hypothetical protein
MSKSNLHTAYSQRKVDKLVKEFAENKLIVIDHFISDTQLQDWLQKAVKVVQKTGRKVNKNLSGKILSYTVVLGADIQLYFQELFHFYQSDQTRNWINTIIQEKNLYCSNHLASAININYMNQVSERYPWHFDEVPYTALLFLSSTKKTDGGYLEVYANVNKAHSDFTKTHSKITILPKAGSLIIMDGSCCYHSVSPLLKPTPRISIPMVYTKSPTHDRSSVVDNFIYT